MTKTILITGASAGFGESATRKLHAEGNKVLLVARREEKLKTITDELGDNADYRVADISIRSDVEELFTNLPEGFQNIDVVINNAGLALGSDKIPDINLDDWDTMIDTNNKGLVYIAQHAAKMMKENGKGQIINLGSVSGEVPYPGGNVYGATKAFVRHFSRNLRIDLHGHNIRVNNIEPGAVAETEFSNVRFKGDDGKAESVYNGWNPLTGSDIADAIVWMINLPDHVNIDNVEIMPTQQTQAGLQIAKNK
ncbi:SDR family NAD(P)-dependent oxidoreductase [Candidatus Saccharibacteria bacterium]|jgi:3-hydroxy acid dehydrogenase/malonic semialdehyde reductase|nr:SDR family NAD(P)-dependent oxidoreductase [Candidatus Saccharibacteria bacterium]